MTKNKINLIGLSHAELTEKLTEVGEKPFREKQLWHWIYFRGETDFSKMTSLSKKSQALMETLYVVERPKIVREQTSKDKTRKWLLGFDDENEVETVYIPETDRGAVCVSSQIGCAFNCKFCNTGTQQLVRNLTAGEIVGQFMVARDSYGEWPSPTDTTRFLSNIVLMGMGEPLNNYDNVVKAVKIIMDPDGIAMSKRRITLSTAGVVPNIRRCAEDLGVKLAISLHAASDDVRDRIMPINKKYPIAELMSACRDYQKITGSRQYITIEYLMLKDVNDSDADARQLIRLVKGMGVKFNLIAFNKWSGACFEEPSSKRVRAFAGILAKAGYASPIRTPRGQDILAACGQLRSDSIRKSD
ncbi:MAG: 23S rRNA (adenine(2503)-C(2))-methyltransferase RlmN [Alphaproteobacteria bacterium]|nr:23S rRNA (adenine(2503)-C(2))-methyltransferase RlmN [Alphaproteobacteria bacterium]